MSCTINKEQAYLGYRAQGLSSSCQGADWARPTQSRRGPDEENPGLHADAEMPGLDTLRPIARFFLRDDANKFIRFMEEDYRRRAEEQRRRYEKQQQQCVARELQRQSKMFADEVSMLPNPETFSSYFRCPRNTTLAERSALCHRLSLTTEFVQRFDNIVKSLQFLPPEQRLTDMCRNAMITTRRLLDKVLLPQNTLQEAQRALWNIRVLRHPDKDGAGGPEKMIFVESGGNLERMYSRPEQASNLKNAQLAAALLKQVSLCIESSDNSSCEVIGAQLYGPGAIPADAPQQDTVSKAAQVGARWSRLLIGACVGAVIIAMLIGLGWFSWGLVATTVV